MIKIENVEVMGWEHAIRGMRNPMNSWDKSDSGWNVYGIEVMATYDEEYYIGSNDQYLMKRLRNAGTDHRKFMRMITVYVDITAPLYWWKEFDTYKVGTVANSCSTMHKIHEKEFTLDDFSCEHLIDDYEICDICTGDYYGPNNPKDILKLMVDILNESRNLYLDTKDKKYWWQMIQLLPSSYNQKRTVMLNYEVLANIYKSRKGHPLDEWSEHKTLGKITKVTETDDELKLEGYKTFGFCDWIKDLPYSELITGDFGNPEE